LAVILRRSATSLPGLTDSPPAQTSGLLSRSCLAASRGAINLCRARRDQPVDSFEAVDVGREGGQAFSSQPGDVSPSIFMAILTKMRVECSQTGPRGRRRVDQGRIELVTSHDGGLHQIKIHVLGAHSGPLSWLERTRRSSACQRRRRPIASRSWKLMPVRPQCHTAFTSWRRQSARLGMMPSMSGLAHKVSNHGNDFSARSMTFISRTARCTTVRSSFC
jgi:hypothetical protein